MPVRQWRNFSALVQAHTQFFCRFMGSFCQFLCLVSCYPWRSPCVIKHILLQVKQLSTDVNNLTHILFQMIAKIWYLKFGKQTMNLTMVTFVIIMLDLGICVIPHRIGAIVKFVETFAKRHVINANNLQISPFSHFAHLDYKF